jgi:hypothetical protein
VIRYRYVTQFQPPAPFVNVSVRCPTTGRHLSQLPAQVDSGCDRTILPGSVITALELVQVGQFSCLGFGSEVMQLPVFLVAISLHYLPPIEVRAVLGEREPCILLGRDVLNNYRIVLDGPQLSLEIG